MPFDCLVTDADGAPYLRYWNTKMKREALVPIDDELRQGILDQQRRVLARFPGGTPVLFPAARANLDGTRPTTTQSYRQALGKWLAACDIRNEHGRPVHLTPHQWRHTLGTTLKRRGIASGASLGMVGDWGWAVASVFAPGRGGLMGAARHAC